MLKKHKQYIKPKISKKKIKLSLLSTRRDVQDAFVNPNGTLLANWQCSPCCSCCG